MSADSAKSIAPEARPVGVHSLLAPPVFWHTKSPEETLRAFRTPAEGLTPEEAKARLELYGPNKLPEQKRKGWGAIFLTQFESPLIYVLVAADIIVFVLREIIDGVIILFVLLFNAILGTIQEGKAQNTLAALKKFTETSAEVLRGGTPRTIRDEEVVPGDIILLSEGEKIPADARLIEAENLSVDEAPLTGESEPVRKTSAALENPGLATAEQRNMVFKGTAIATGYGKAVAVATGTETVIGRLSQRILQIDTEIPLTKNLRSLARTVVVIVIALIAVLFATGIAEGKPFAEMFVAAVAIAVAAVPEGLPLVLTVILAFGVSRMAKRRVLVKKLQAVEALGEAEDIAVDKTGTITKNELVLAEVRMNGARYAIHGIGYDRTPKIEAPDRHLLLAARIALLCSNARLSSDEREGTMRVVGDPTEAALTVFGEKAGFTKEGVRREYDSVADWPFDYAKKIHAALAKRSQGNFLAVTGAPETLLALSNEWVFEDASRPLTEDARKDIEAQFLSLSEQGFRVIAFAFKENAPSGITPDSLPFLTFGGLFAMQDGLRPGIRDAVAQAKEAGIHVILVTGDHAATARTIARQAGIYEDGDGVLTGADIDALPPEEFRERLKKTTVYARVTPEHKIKIIEAYRARGETIAMTGDGVNDAPSLVAADLGIAMGKIGTEVTKEAADLVLMDDNFGDIVRAVEEGRSMRQGIRRTITYLFSSNLGEIVLIALALAWDTPLPLIAAQIIWMNLVTDTFFDISLAMEPNDHALMRSVARTKRLFDRRVAGRLALIAPVIGAGAFFLFEAASADIARARTIALTALIVFQWFNAWNCRSETKSVFSLKFFGNRFLVATLLIVMALHFAAVYTDPLRTILELTPLSPIDWARIALTASAVLIAEECRKWFARRRTAAARA